ncbi:tripartite tricarboxylate transporter TctB family protein [Alkalihalobacillus sp. AL-G]|uniref:tripartite tricarboxylate transporter TctB family protein n=1 Tax=Alkalihalobacillus sp. AL-G TaxID=2926399 RepID=UPI00272CCDAB|nr:tripartite tricarboxylate transporter TctB family protein [Alkalihalobacillus sp. AL-G]WLD93764.1 tripartite tricarboxylate transporter TctB family protein [Alkalihalobacillus sp. AL-G]
MTKDRIAGVVLLIFCIFFYFQTKLIDIKDLTEISAAFFPRLLLGLIAGLTVVMIIQSFLKKERKTASEKEKNEKEGIVWIIFALFALYILSLALLGFIISSFIFITIVYLIILPVKRPVKSHVIALSSILVITIALSFIFENLLNVFLPTGIFF